MRELMSVADAARALKLDPSRVRVLAASEALPAVKIGRSWAIDAAAVADRSQHAPPRGRPMAPANAWALLFIASGQEPEWASAQSRSRIRRSLRLEGIGPMRDRLKRRAKALSFRSHPGEISYLLSDPKLVPSGISAAGALGLDLVSGAEVDGYIPENDLASLVRDHALRPVEAGGDGNVRLRVVPDAAWHLQRPAPPAAAVALDLLEDPDPRSKRAGEMLLREFNDIVQQP